MNSPWKKNAYLAGARVSIDAGHGVVDDLLEAELGEYFGYEPLVGDEDPGSFLAHVEYVPREYTQPSQAGDQVVLHDGSHAYDQRRGTVWNLAGGVRIIASHQTGSVIRADSSRRTVQVFGADPKSSASDVRRVVRDLIYLPWLESRGAVVVHGSAVVDENGEAILILGDRGAGKTTLFMSAADRGTTSAIACERIILLPTAHGLLAYGCPENISIFPGMLRKFRQTSDIPGGNEADDWEREAKIRVPWRDLFARLGLTPAHGVRLGKIVLPRWSDAGLQHRDVSDQESYFKVLPHIITGRDVNRPDWLSWFAAQGTEQTIRELASHRVIEGTWNNRHDACDLMFSN